MEDEYRRWKVNTEDDSSPAKATMFVYWVMLCLILCCFEVDTHTLEPVPCHCFGAVHRTNQ